MYVISGMTAAIGAAWAITKTGSVSHSTERLRPIATPAPTPMTAEMATPMTRGWSVDAYARTSEPSSAMRPSARAVWLNAGKAGLTGHRPAHSQRPKKSANDAPTQRAWRAVRPLTPASRADALERRLERCEVPEVLGLQCVALDLAGQGVEVEVGGGGLRRPAVRREDAAPDAFLVVEQHLRLQLLRKVLQEAEPLALLDGEARVRVDR